MSFARKKKSSMEKRTADGKMKIVASIPPNYVSILQLQERWMKEKEGRLKERDDLGVKQQQVNGEEEPWVKLEGKSFAEKEEAEVSAVVSKKKDKDGEYSRERKKKWSKKKNHGGSVKEVVKCGSKAYIPREITSEEKTFQNRENTAASNLIAVATQFQHLQIKKRVEEDRQVKGPARLNSGHGHYRNQKHEARTMVWVKKDLDYGTH